MTNASDLTERVADVTQADRERASATYNRVSRIHDRVNCHYEHTEYLAQQFARHRTAAIAAARPAILEEALNALPDDCGDMGEWADGFAAGVRNSQDAIRALGSQDA